MTATAVLDATAVAPPQPRGRRLWLLARVPLGYLLFSLLLYWGLWADPNDTYLPDSGHDQNQWEWFFAVTARAVTEFDNPLFTTLQNQPEGVNLMANTTMLGVSVPLTPVTLLLGPGVTWVLVLNAGLAATAIAWFWLLRHRLGHSELAAAVGGGFCAFAPPVITHAHAHPNFTVLFVLPFLVALLLRIWDGDRPARNGVLLGLLLAYQIFLGEEVLLLFALGMLVFGIAYAANRPRETQAAVKPLATGLGLAAGVSLSLVAFPLYWQFFGPQSYDGLLHGNAGNDLTALTAFASRSLAGTDAARELASPTEQNAFFGWPLVILLGFAIAALWRVALARVLASVIITATLLSLGSYLVVAGVTTPVPGPWLALSGLPRWQRTPRLLWTGAFLAVLVPLLPTPFPAVDRAETPRFFTAGLWRDYADPGGTLVPVPPPSAGNSEPLNWQVRADLGFRLPEGYFVGPAGADRHGIYGAEPRPTSLLLREVADSGEVPDIGPAQREQAREDLQYWDADAVVLAPRYHDAELLDAVERLLGRGARVGGVWVWEVR